METQGASVTGERMRKARERARMSFSQVAAAITVATGGAVTEATVRRWENGTIDVPASRLLEFAAAVGCSPASLMPSGVQS